MVPGDVGLKPDAEEAHQHSQRPWVFVWARNALWDPKQGQIEASLSLASSVRFLFLVSQVSEELEAEMLTEVNPN